MNKELTAKVFIWCGRLILMAWLLAMTLLVKSCVEGSEINLQDYTGWIHDCEMSGGVAFGGVCYDPSALIDMSDQDE